MGCRDGRPLSEPATGLFPGPEAPGSAERDEAALRTRLGIPPEAKHVLVFGETSHWDPNWLHTTEEYYALCIPAHPRPRAAGARGGAAPSLLD